MVYKKTRAEQAEGVEHIVQRHQEMVQGERTSQLQQTGDGIVLLQN